MVNVMTRGLALVQTTQLADDRLIQLDLRRENDAVALIVDSPSLALFANPRLRNSGGRTLLQEWMLGQPNSPGPDQWAVDVLGGVRQRIAGGLQPFSQIFPNVGVNGAGISVTREFFNQPNRTINLVGSSPQIGVELPGMSSEQVFRELLRTVQAMPRRGRSAGRSSIRLGSFDDVVQPGYLGNGDVFMGDGKDIILSSPHVYAIVMHRQMGDSSGRSGNAAIYYPIAYALRGTIENQNGNNYYGENGDDCIYYDASVATADGGAGDDIFAPSYGSFNWAVDTFAQGLMRWVSLRDGNNLIGNFSRRSANQEARSQEPWLYSSQTISNGLLTPIFTFVHGDAALLSPVSHVKDSQGIGSDHGNRFSNQFYYEFEHEATFPRGRINNFNTRILPRANWGLRQNQAGILDLDRTLANRIGGQRLVGGDGQDTFFGIDPDWYRDWGTVTNGLGQRQAFYSQNDPNNRQSRPFERPHAQLMSPVEMFGGVGGDTFTFGNPRNLQPWSLQGGDYLYRVSGNHDDNPGVNRVPRRDDARYGANADSDVFQFNLTYQGDTWTRLVSSGASAVGGPSGLDITRLVGNGFSTLKDGTSIFKDLANSKHAWLAGIKKFSAAFTALSSIFSIGTAIWNIVERSRAARSESIPETSSYYRDPVGDWRQSVNIRDWDPADTIAIRVDPSNSAANRSHRWENIQFQFNRVVNSSSFDGSELVVSTANGGSTRQVPLVRLEEFGGVPGGFAWRVHDFDRGSPRIIGSGDRDMAFFGQIPINAVSVHPGGRDRYNFNVPRGSRMFRWTDDQGMPANTLNQLRSSAENIVLEHDTMAFGYYWDLRLSTDATAANQLETTRILKDPRIDLDTSSLWIRNVMQRDPVSGRDLGKPVDWNPYSLRSLRDDPSSQILARQATPYWDRVTRLPRASSFPRTNEISPETRLDQLIHGLKALDKALPGDLPALRRAASGSASDGSGGVRLVEARFNLVDLNSVRAISAASSTKDENPAVVVYYDAPEDSGYVMLKTTIKAGLSAGVYGMHAQQLSLEEKTTGLDINADGFLA